METLLFLSAPSFTEYSRFVGSIQNISDYNWFIVTLILVQVIYFLCRTLFKDLLGIHQILILAALSVLATIGANILAGKTFLESTVLDASTLMAYQVFFHQIQKQWSKREKDRKSIDARKSCKLRSKRAKERFEKVCTRKQLSKRRNHSQRKALFRFSTIKFSKR